MPYYNGLECNLIRLVMVRVKFFASGSCRMIKTPIPRPEPNGRRLTHKRFRHSGDSATCRQISCGVHQLLLLSPLKTL